MSATTNSPNACPAPMGAAAASSSPAPPATTPAAPGKRKKFTKADDAAITGEARLTPCHHCIDLMINNGVGPCLAGDAPAFKCKRCSFETYGRSDCLDVPVEVVEAAKRLQRAVVARRDGNGDEEEWRQAVAAIEKARTRAREAGSKPVISKASAEFRAARAAKAAEKDARREARASQRGGRPGRHPRAPQPRPAPAADQTPTVAQNTQRDEDGDSVMTDVAPASKLADVPTDQLIAEFEARTSKTPLEQAGIQEIWNEVARRHL